MKIAVFVQNRDFFGAKLIHIPLLYSIYKKYNMPEIVLFTPYKNNNIFLEFKIVSKVIYYENSILKVLSYLKRENIDIVISLRPDSIWLNIAMFLSKIKTRIGFRNSIDFLANDITKIYNKKIYRAIAFNNILDDNSDIKEYFDVFFDTRKLSYKKTIFILPCGGDSFKKWDIKNFIDLAYRLSNYDDFYFVFVVGDNEKEYIKQIKDFLNKKEGNILYNESFSNLVSYFKSGYLFISNDCGPSHIAQMLYKPIVILYSDIEHDCDKVIKEWFLPHEKSSFIKTNVGEDINTISVDMVFNSVIDILRKIK